MSSSHFKTAEEQNSGEGDLNSRPKDFSVITLQSSALPLSYPRCCRSDLTSRLPACVKTSAEARFEVQGIAPSDSAFIAQLGERQTEDLKVPSSILGEGTLTFAVLFLAPRV